ncbi:MAG: YbaN family protein [Pseudomonadota bacterium]
MKFLWVSAGWISVSLGVIGIFLPLLPTTPFLLLGAFCFSKGSEKLHTWLIEHPRLGPPILQWRQHRAISRRIKWVATVTMLALFLLSAAMQVPLWALGTQAAVLVCVSAFIWTRKETSLDNSNHASGHAHD